MGKQRTTEANEQMLLQPGVEGEVRQDGQSVEVKNGSSNYFIFNVSSQGGSGVILITDD